MPGNRISEVYYIMPYLSIGGGEKDLASLGLLPPREIEAFFERKVGLVESAAFFPGLAEMTWPEKKQALTPLGDKLARSDSINTYLYCNPDGSYYRSDNPGNPARDGLMTGNNSDPASAPALLNTRDYFAYLVGTNMTGERRTYVSNPMLARSTGQKLVIIGSSVIDQAGDVAGLLGIYIEDHTLEDLLDSLTATLRDNFGEQMILLVFSENNTILSHREFDPSLGRYSERALNVNDEINIDSLPADLQRAGSQQILEAISQLNDTTQMVKDGSAEMLEGSGQVIKEGKNLESITQEIAEGMNEMAAGSEQINVTVNRVNGISGQNKENIDILVAEVSRFKVE
jgi:hypothetical protein